LWNMFALSIVLTSLGLILFASTRASMYRAVDDDLGRRAKFLETNWDRTRQRGHHLDHDHDADHDHDRLLADRRQDPPLGSEVDPEQFSRVAFDEFIEHPRIQRLGEQSDEDRPWSSDAMARSLGGSREFLDSNIQEHGVRILSFPIRSNGGIVAAAQFAAPLDETRAATAQLGRSMLVMLPVALIATSVVGVWLTRRALHPVAQFAFSAGRIEAHNLSERLPETGKDEFAELAHVFNLMLDRVERSFRQLEDAYHSQRRFIADASHELKTPLATIKTRLGVALRKEQTPSRYVEHLQSIQGATNSMTAIIGDLLLLARSDEGNPTGSVSVIPLASLADEAASLISDVYARSIEMDIEEGLTVEGHEGSVSRLLVNLLDNAARYTPPTGVVEIAGYRENGAVVTRVRDTGVGISPEDVPHVFERFYRVAAARDRESGGTGLGLAIVLSIVKAHRGEVELESTPGKGTTVTVTLPLRQEPTTLFESEPKPLQI
jgi:signal transduction histidine kinase